LRLFSWRTSLFTLLNTPSQVLLCLPHLLGSANYSWLSWLSDCFSLRRPGSWQYGPRIAWWWRTPFWIIAAHIVMLPPRCPGTLMKAWCSMIFLPRPLVFARLKHVSSTYISSWCTASASSSMTLWKSQDKTMLHSRKRQGSVNMM
jgi:hypothetical protein